MASIQELTEDLLEEFGKSSSKARIKVERWVTEVVIDLLMQNDGRFKELGETFEFTALTYDHYKLPANYLSAGTSFSIVDSDGNFVRKAYLKSEKDLLERRHHSDYSGSDLAYIEYRKSGRERRGYYVVLGTAPSEAIYYKLRYYRKPTGEDAPIINKTSIIKTGVRGKAHIYNANSRIDAGTYARMRSGFGEPALRHSPDMKMVPSKKTRIRNEVMGDIGDGN